MRVLKGALHNFLATLTSRYSDHDGYWLFGFLVVDQLPLQMDLLHPDTTLEADSPLSSLNQTAIRKFAEQLRKNGAARQNLMAASLTVRRAPHRVHGWQNGHYVPGSEVVVSAQAQTITGRIHQRTITTFVAPHNPDFELRSGRQPDHDSST